MTPYEIGILLHYHAHCDDHPDVRRNPPVWRPTIDSFVSLGVLREAVGGERSHGASWVMTDRGHAYCVSLQRVPLPESEWITTWPNADLIKAARGAQ